MFDVKKCSEYVMQLSKMKGAFNFKQCIISAVKYYNHGVYSGEYASMVGKYLAAQKKSKDNRQRSNIMKKQRKFDISKCSIEIVSTNVGNKIWVCFDRYTSYLSKTVGPKKYLESIIIYLEKRGYIDLFYWDQGIGESK